MPAPIAAAASSLVMLTFCIGDDRSSHRTARKDPTMPE